MTIRISKGGKWYSCLDRLPGGVNALSFSYCKNGISQHLNTQVFFEDEGRYIDHPNAMFFQGAWRKFLTLKMCGPARWTSSIVVYFQDKSFPVSVGVTVVTSDNKFYAPETSGGYWRASYIQLDETASITDAGVLYPDLPIPIDGEIGKMYFVPTSQGTFLQLYRKSRYGFPEIGIGQLSTTRYESPMVMPGFQYELA